MKRGRPVQAIAAVIVFAACASASPFERSRTPTSSDILTTPELETVVGTSQNAYSAVERLRPFFLTVRPGSGTLHERAPGIHVFINESLAGDIDALKTIPLASIASIRRVQATTAYTQLGEIHAGDGVILVRLR